MSKLVYANSSPARITTTITTTTTTVPQEEMNRAAVARARHHHRTTTTRPQTKTIPRAVVVAGMARARHRRRTIIIRPRMKTIPREVAAVLVPAEPRQTKETTIAQVAVQNRRPRQVVATIHQHQATTAEQAALPGHPAVAMGMRAQPPVVVATIATAHRVRAAATAATTMPVAPAIAAVAHQDQAAPLVMEAAVVVHQVQAMVLALIPVLHRHHPILALQVHHQVVMVLPLEAAAALRRLVQRTRRLPRRRPHRQVVLSQQHQQVCL